MASLRDQLLKSGLADKNSAKKIQKEKSKQIKSARKSNQQLVDEAKLSAERARAKQIEHDRALNLERQAEAEKKALSAQIAQLIQMNKVDREAGEIAFSFVHGKKLKNILVNSTMQSQLGSGHLAIVHYKPGKDFKYEIVPSIVARKIAERDPEAITHLEQNNADENQQNENDPYSEYEIPDDLMW